MAALLWIYLTLYSPIHDYVSLQYLGSTIWLLWLNPCSVTIVNHLQKTSWGHHNLSTIPSYSLCHFFYLHKSLAQIPLPHLIMSHIYTVSQWLMMSHIFLWCLTVSHNVSQCLNVSWCFIVSDNVSQNVMVSHDVSLCIKMSYDVLQCLTMFHGVSWRLTVSQCLTVSHDVTMSQDVS